MHPILFDFGTWDLPLAGPTHLFLPTYGLVFAAAVLAAWGWFLRRARTLDVSNDDAFNLAFWSLLAGLVGAKLTLIAVDWRYYLEEPAQILGTLRSAGVLLGGVAAGAAGFVLFARAKGLPLHDLGDAIAAPLALSQGIGRLGCLAAGCCWGVETDSWCAIRFRSAEAHAQTGVPLDLPLVPVQLIESLYDLSLAVLLTMLWRRRPRPAGTVFWVFVILYGLGRGVLEHWRGDAQRGLWLGGAISTSQILSLLAVATAVTFLVLDRRRAARAHED